MILSNDSTISHIIDSIKALYFNTHLKDTFIINVSNATAGTFWETWGSTIFGLIGVFIGAGIAYYFNIRLSKQQSVSRYAIQRKNLIIAPIYKKILRLIDYVQNPEYRCFVSIKTGNDRIYLYPRYTHWSFDFSLWHDIKSDIRENYIVKNIRACLDSLYGSIDYYNSNLRIVFDDLLHLREQLELRSFESKIQFLDEKKNRSLDIGSYNHSIYDIFFLIKNEKLDPVDFYFNYYYIKDSETNLEYKNKLKEYFTLLRNNQFVTAYINSYLNLEKQILKTKNEINKFINFVIDNYEYGKEIEKYDI